ncbi:hypothetical protein L0Y69_03290 [bacterium]|nr:hypothetical protein [bacterium]
MKSLAKIFVPSLAVVVLASGCAASKDMLRLNYVPDVVPKSIGDKNVEADKKSCRALAVEQSKKLGTGQTTNILLGAAAGAATGCLIGCHPLANTGLALIAGGTVGAGVGALAVDPDPDPDTYRNCLKGRGYEILN